MEIVIRMSETNAKLLKKCIKEHLDYLAKTENLIYNDLEDLLEMLTKKLIFCFNVQSRVFIRALEKTLQRSGSVRQKSCFGAFEWH